MNVEIKGIHLEVNERTRQYLDAKMPRLDFAGSLITDFLLNIAREKNLYILDVTINFRWGASTHVGVEGFDLFKAIDELFDKLESKIEKEKSKIQEHHKKGVEASEAE